MQITRKSILTGIERTLEIPVTQEQLDKWASGVLIQDAMPNLTPDQREFIMNGITAEEWEDFLGEEE
jgi:hypothetical protein